MKIGVSSPWGRRPGKPRSPTRRTNRKCLIIPEWKLTDFHSRTSILTAAARAFGSREPDLSVRNPDWQDGKMPEEASKEGKTQMEGVPAHEALRRNHHRDWPGRPGRGGAILRRGQDSRHHRT